jgi:predicted nucleic acid-binding protein
VTRLLVDNSVLQRVARSDAVKAALTTALDRGDELCCMVLTTIEAGFSARSAADHEQILLRQQSAFTPLVIGPAAQGIAVELQQALFAAGKGRAAGVVDLLIAATAIEQDVVVLHYDSDFDAIASVDQRLQARWAVLRGCVP